jgi:peptidylprolyl isomerase
MIRPLTIALAALLAATVPAFADQIVRDKRAGTHGGAHSAHRAPATVTLKDGLMYTDVKVGTGKTPEPGQTVVVQYTGTFPDGRKFDSSLDRNEPFSFHLGTHEVIPCWDEGVATMRKGGRRKLVCPPELAYGEKGAGNVVPPNATLDFDVELIDIK